MMKTFLHEVRKIAAPLLYPKGVRLYIRLKSPDKVTLSPPFINDQLDYDIKSKWKSNIPIFIDGRTGCGKTSFIIKKLIYGAI